MSKGFASSPPDDFYKQRFWCFLSTLGQLNARIVRQYQRLPWSLAQLVNTNIDASSRLALANKFLNMKPCCIDPFFSKPVLDDIRSNGGNVSILPGHGSGLFSDLCTAFRGKCTNIELELNFSRAACSRACMRGRKHSISSMVSKHITAECKVAHIRSQEVSLRQDDNQIEDADPGICFQT